MKISYSTILMLASVFFVSSSWACFYYPNSFKGMTSEGTEDIFLYHDGVNANMIIRTTLQAKKFPAEVAWILPFPSLPSKYEEIKGPFFQELQDILPDREKFGSRGSKAGMLAAGGGGSIKVHESVTLGQYVIQPIEILKDDSAQELNAWLKKNRFKMAPHRNQKAYLKKGAALLAIRMQLNQSTATELVSHSLHITYPSDRLSVPLRFSHIGRTLDLNLYVFSNHEMKKDLNKFYLSRDTSASYENQRLHPFVDSLLLKQKGYITLYTAKKLNSKTKSLHKLTDDPFFLISEL